MLPDRKPGRSQGSSHWEFFPFLIDPSVTCFNYLKHLFYKFRADFRFFYCQRSSWISLSCLKAEILPFLQSFVSYFFLSLPLYFEIFSMLFRNSLLNDWRTVFLVDIPSFTLESPIIYIKTMAPIVVLNINAHFFYYFHRIK